MLVFFGSPVFRYSPRAQKKRAVGCRCTRVYLTQASAIKAKISQFFAKELFYKVDKIGFCLNCR
ncbi:hypothetical protein BCY91_12865 [Pelobium manganitolerans]|uniref:Uncharacterized protein n=1 Tax=Pelobium manganitolerans TaxID=1842495 RepID=A0A419SB14_9SPHI|nr:hypothetical protein BCY91_12865 [Pelobium manganitolerans]